MSKKYNHSWPLKFEGFRSFLGCAENETAPQFVTELTLPGDSLDINASFLDTGATFPDVLGWLFHLLKRRKIKVAETCHMLLLSLMMKLLNN